MRLVVMGTGPFAVPMFRALLESRHDVAMLVTRPVPPARERQKTAPNPMRDVAESSGIPVYAPESVNVDETRGELLRHRADLFVVCDYGQILKPDTLRIPRLGGINLHASLLPKYRGAAPIHWAIYRGETETGVSVIHMTPKLDGGPILAVRRVSIGAEETAGELESRLAQVGIQAVLDAIDRLGAWDGTSEIGQRQDPSQVSLAPRLKKTDGLVDWSRSAAQIANQVRAFQPWPATFTTVPWTATNGAAKEPLRVILVRVRVVDWPAPPGASEAHEPGVVVEADGRRMFVATGQGVLSLESVQPSGKRAMDTADFLNGYRIAVGTRLG